MKSEAVPLSPLVLSSALETSSLFRQEFMARAVSRTLLFSVLLGLVVAFQNCSRTQTDESVLQQAAVEGSPGSNVGDAADGGGAAGPASGNQINPENFNAQNIDFIDFYVNSLPAQVSREYLGRVIKVDLKNGQAVLLTSDGLGQERSINLPKGFVEHILRTLAKAQFCLPPQNTDPNRMCTMIYGYPYAVLFAGQQELRLGESTSGCDKGPDICEPQQKEKLQEISLELIKKFFDSDKTN